MKNLTEYRITVEDESHLTQVASRRFTIPVILGIGTAFVVLCLVISGLIISLTPLSTLLPGYLEDSQRSATEEGLLRLDSLMSAYEVDRAFIENFLRVTDPTREPGDSAAVKMVSRELSADSLMPTTNEEREFVSQMEERERFNISVLAPLAADGMIFSPVCGDGIFTKESETSTEGTVIIPAGDNVHSAADGSVIALYYSAADRGYVLVTQHNRGFVTSYAHIGSPLVGVGDYVTAGQIVAFAPAPDSKGSRKVTVRMWHNGLPIIPFEYLGVPVPSAMQSAMPYEAPRGRL